MSLQRVEMLISGVVQGIGYRYFVYRSARQLDLVGWVRNLPDGRVQAVAEGERGVLEIFIKELKTGPRFASVHKIDLKWAEPTGQYTTFDIQ